MEPRRPLITRVGVRVCAGLFLATTSLFAVTPRAHAQDETYRRLAEEAARAMAERRPTDALVIFREMHALAPSARTSWSLGRVHYELGRYVTALDYLGQALSDPRRPLEAAQREEVLALQARAEALTGVLALTVAPAEATVLVDDVEVPRSEGARIPGLLSRSQHVRIVEGVQTSSLALELRLDPGDHVVRIERAGRDPAVRRVQIRPGERASAEILDLTPASESLSGGLGVQIGASLERAQLAPADARISVVLAPEETRALTLHLQPLAIAGAPGPIGPPERLCTAPCEARHARGSYAAHVSLPGDDALVAAPGVVPIVSDTLLTVSFHDETVTRIAGWIGTGLIVGYGLVGTVLGAAAFAVGRDDRFRVSLGEATPGVLLGTGISSIVLGLLGLPFALAPDWGEIRVSPLR